ncbi:MAG: YicC family protein [Deltaproteobacteria bacterium]|nr:YicC family protein [Deltaproteobacteria bacterium]
MATSMTGFGRGVGEASGVVLVAELRSVNHRYLEVRSHLPQPLLFLEPQLLAQIQARLQRGRVDAVVREDRRSLSLTAVHPDLDLARRHLDALRQLGDALHLTGSIDLMALAGFKGVIVGDDPSDVASSAGPALEAALAAALDDLIEMRAGEGRRLVADIAARLDAMGGIADRAGELAPAAAERARVRLEARIRELLASAGHTAAVDEARLLTEVALIAERNDVTEELVRLRAHLAAMRSLIAQEGAIGRKADFLCQELLREINTLGSKSADVAVTGLVVEMKTELERVREQVQNLE